MSGRFYRFVCFLGRPVFWICSRPVILHRERSALEGGYLLASNHFSPYDVACLMYTTRRQIDWVSIVEFFEKPLVAWFFKSLNAMPLDRGKVDSATVRSIISRLSAGRVVGIFPEAGIRRPDNSVLRGGRFKSGIGRMALVASVPIVPCVILDTKKFSRPTAWLPLRRTRYAVAYGEPIHPPENLEGRAARRWMEEQWQAAVVALDDELGRAYSGSSRSAKRSASGTGSKSQ